ncbi:hypothetical protein [Streptomyces sp. CC224B]|uniref:DUF7848 domain-containing protein n=1 Tax=Streptomyces sp. CC224B TaxID=3044571 RepID=UPI0024A933E0|nr:hypothetical protein [Streptomyces sp. CC224B]
MARTSYRYIDWTLGADPAQPSHRRIECADCPAASGDSPGQLGPDRWALQHAGATGHRGYRETVISHLRATPAEDA